MHTLENNDEKPSLRGKMVAFFTLESDPIIKKIKETLQSREEKKPEYEIVT